MIAEVIAFDFSTGGMTVPLLVAAVIAVAGYFLLSKKQQPQAQASSLASSVTGLFSGNRLTMLASLAALLMQAGSLRDFAKKLLAKLIEFANKEPVPPADPKPVEEPK